jgi:hypothetical protein
MTTFFLLSFMKGPYWKIEKPTSTVVRTRSTADISFDTPRTTLQSGTHATKLQITKQAFLSATYKDVGKAMQGMRLAISEFPSKNGSHFASHGLRATISHQT